MAGVEAKPSARSANIARLAVALVLSSFQADADAQDFPNNLRLHAVWGSSPTDVWAAGVTQMDGKIPGLYHFDGETWSQGAIDAELETLLFPGTPSDVIEFQTIAGNAPNNIYAVATRSDQAGKFVVRYDGSTWKLHGYISSDQYTSSWVAPDTGDVYIGGRAFSGGGSIIRKAAGATTVGGDPDPTAAAGTAFGIVFSSSAYGLGVINISGYPGNELEGKTGEVFFASTSGMYQFGGTSVGVVHPLIDGWGSYAVPASYVLAIANSGGDPDVFVANQNGVAAFTWNGSSLTANGDTGVAPSFGLGQTGATVGLGGFRTTIGEGAGSVNTLLAIQNAGDQNSVLQYDFGAKQWVLLDTWLHPLNDLIVFPDGTYFAVGDVGTVLTNFVAGANRYVWDNTVEAQGDHNFHGSTGGPTNWFIGDTMDRHPTIESGGDFEINAGDVTLADQAVIAKTINATGSFSLENSLTLAQGNSSIENMSIQAPLSVDGLLTLVGDNNFWTAGNLAGSGSVEVAGMLTFGAPSTTFALGTTLETRNGGITTIEDGSLDLSAGGVVEILEGGTLNMHDISIVGASLPSSFVNRGTLVKAGTGTGIIDISGFKNEPMGDIQVDEGILSFPGSGIFAGVLDTKANAMTVFDSAEISTGGLMGESLTIQGLGPVTFTQGGLQISDGIGTILTANGDTGGLIVGSDVDIYGTGTLRVEETGLFRYAGNGLDTFDGGVVVDGSFKVQSGTLELTGSVTATGQFPAEGGELRFSAPMGTTNHFDGAIFYVSAGAKVSFDSAETLVTGTTQLNGDGDVVLGDGKTITIGDGMNSTILFNALTGNPLRLGGADLVGSGDASLTWLENEANMVLDRGSVTGLLIVNHPASLGSGLLTIARDEAFPSDGVMFENSSIQNDINGLIDQSSLITTTGGPLQIDNYGTYKVSDANLSSAVGLITLTNHDSGGGVLGRVEFSGTSQFDGDFENDGLVVVNEGADVVIGNSLNSVPSLPDGIVVNKGTWDVRNGLMRSAVSLSGEWGFAPLVTVGANAKVYLTGPNAGFNPVLDPDAVDVEFSILGRLSVTDQMFKAPLGPSLGSPFGFTLNKSMEIGKDGVLVLSNATIEIPSGGGLFNGGYVLGTGEIHGNVIGVGGIADTVIISPGFSPGVIEISGEFYNGQSSTLEIEIGGLEGTYDYDQLIVGSTATFAEGSKIRITLIDPNPDDGIDEVFVPRTGDAFSFLVADNVELPMGMSLADFVEFTNLPAGVDLTPQLAVVNGQTQIVLETDSTLTPPAGPRIISHPKARTVTAGNSTTLSVTADGATDFTYQWQRNGVDIPGATGSSYTLPSTQFLHAGEYTVVVTADGVSTTSKIAALDVAEPPPSNARLVNISTRAIAGSGESTLILGFYIAGTGSKTLLIRGLGPKLQEYSIPNFVEDPSIVLYSGEDPIADNNDWNPALADDFLQVGAVDLTPGSTDAAMKVTLPPGGYTVHLVNPGSLAEAVIEIYDFSKDSGTRLANLSTRLLLAEGETIIVGTYVDNDTVALPIIVRAVGPALGDYDLVGFHPDPQLRVFQGSTDIGFDDDWDSSLQSRFAEVGAFPLTEGSKDAAVRMAVKPGGYTMHTTGIGEGIVLVELYGAP